MKTKRRTPVYVTAILKNISKIYFSLKYILYIIVYLKLRQNINYCRNNSLLIRFTRIIPISLLNFLTPLNTKFPFTTDFWKTLIVLIEEFLYPNSMPMNILMNITYILQI